MEIKLLSFTPDSEKHIELCGRICYNSLDKITDDSYKGFIRGIMSRGHYSVIEHAYATILIENVSRATTHQLVRHRHMSYSQQSQRYVKQQQFSDKEEVRDFFVVPNKIAENEMAMSMYLHAIETSQNMYAELLKLDILPEDARSVLPNATNTTIVVTGNFRSWFEFLQKRLDLHAQEEIRMISGHCLRLLNQVAPNIFCLGTLVESPQYRYSADVMKEVA